jgi:glucose/arabinose dehydrogenase
MDALARSSLMLTALALLSCQSPAGAQDLGNLQVFQTGLPGAAFLGSPPGEPERIMIGQLNGLIHVVENGVLLPTPFLDIRSRLTELHGLIGVAFPPDYATSRRFYVNYTPNVGNQPRVARYTTSDDPNIANNVEEILLHTGGGRGDHAAGWMDFGRDGYLYIARGDVGGSPQSPAQFQGKLLRLDVSPATGYVCPPDNPYVGIAGLDEIVAIGLRNPWRNGFDSLTGDLYLADVGDLQVEEISYVPAGTLIGRNFGWFCMEGTLCRSTTPPCTCSSPPMTAPIHVYGRSTGATVIGGTVYRGSAIPRWRGRYFFADTWSDRVWSFRAVNGMRVDLQEHTADLNEGSAGVIVAPIAFGEDGARELYIMELGGRILKITPAFAAADWDMDGVVNSSDFFAFLKDFFELNADFTGDHATTSQDFFDYLAAFFGE